MENMLTTPKIATAAFIGNVRLQDAHTGHIFDETVQAFVSAHDIRCCNFEGAVDHANPVVSKKAGASFLQGKTAAARVLNSGINLVSLANNHLMDYGETGLFETIRALSAVTTLGAAETPPLAYRPFVTMINGIKLGFLALCERQNGALDGTRTSGVAWICHPAVLHNIRLLRSECTHVIILSHAGLEEADQPLPEWRSLYRQFVDAGASLIVGSHPRMPQGWEWYKNGLILYSLGNAAWAPKADASDQSALLASVTFPSSGAVKLSMRPITYRNEQIAFDESEKTQAQLNERNRVLADDEAYASQSKRICKAFYEQVAQPDFFAITGCLPGDAWQQSKNAVKFLIRKHALNESLLLSILENETYRWATAAALRERIGNE
ncbi:MAG: CapA family protein [Clostridia bacterium]